MSASARLGRPKTPFLRTSNVLWDEIDLSTVDEMAISPEELSVKSLRRGDLLVCEGGEIGRSAIWEEDIAPMAFQNHLHRLRPAVEGVEPRFYVYFLQSAFTQLDLFRGAGNQTTIPNLSRSRLSALEVPLPNREEQRIIAKTLRFVRTAVGTQQRLVALAQELKQAASRHLFMRGLHNEPTKDTEIGSIPRSWRLSTIGDLFEIEQGLSLKGNLTRSEEGTPFLRTSNVYWGRFDLNSVSRMRLDGEVPERKRVQNGDLLVCEGGDIGRAAVWRREEEGVVFQNHLHRLRVRSSVGDSATRPHFVRAWLEEGFVNRGVYEGAGNRTTIPNLSRSRLAGLAVPDPPVHEQVEIVAMIGAIENKLENSRRKCSLLEQLFRTLLHDLMTGRIRADELELSKLGNYAGTNTERDGRK